ncbi:DUF1289 domain-containing protein [Coxiella endosymbiont of Amblyomma nuttalli]|uniref:DUF1289 domain-containing protein n=1 Tax=Coxiella endosymbiont of Amblyomma nuttalli TaxID=2749996 RepID=UPI001BB4B322|nr:DUF1289 domain-containing protein [Coxiella endosymbiont of Amblyomma nuttalli]QTS84010.1 hypothetical protein CEAn_00498 [Coxiella endosymbiont of Amblyomma nuttalli]
MVALKIVVVSTIIELVRMKIYAKIKTDEESMNILGVRNLIDSPCIGICSATALGDEICVGCGRTFEEVYRWNMLPDKEKVAINRRLQKRKEIIIGT